MQKIQYSVIILSILFLFMKKFLIILAIIGVLFLVLQHKNAVYAIIHNKKPAWPAITNYENRWDNGNDDTIYNSTYSASDQEWYWPNKLPPDNIKYITANYGWDLQKIKDDEIFITCQQAGSGVKSKDPIDTVNKTNTIDF